MAECTGFENRRGASHRGFESFRLRHLPLCPAVPQALAWALQDKGLRFTPNSMSPYFRGAWTGLPPIAQSPDLISSIKTQLPDRFSSPVTRTIASVTS